MVDKAVSIAVELKGHQIIGELRQRKEDYQVR